jgi:hypothetical protein
VNVVESLSVVIYDVDTQHGRGERSELRPCWLVPTELVLEAPSSLQYRKGGAMKVGTLTPNLQSEAHYIHLAAISSPPLDIPFSSPMKQLEYSPPIGTSTNLAHLG